MTRLEEVAATSDFIFPDDATLEKGYSFMALSDEESTDYQRQFNEVMAG